MISAVQTASAMRLEAARADHSASNAPSRRAISR